MSAITMKLNTIKMQIDKTLKSLEVESSKEKIFAKVEKIKANAAKLPKSVSDSALKFIKHVQSKLSPKKLEAIKDDPTNGMKAIIEDINFKEGLRLFYTITNGLKLSLIVGATMTGDKIGPLKVALLAYISYVLYLINTDYEDESTPIGEYFGWINNKLNKIRIALANLDLVELVEGVTGLLIFTLYKSFVATLKLLVYDKVYLFLTVSLFAGMYAMAYEK